MARNRQRLRASPLLGKNRDVRRDVVLQKRGILSELVKRGGTRHYLLSRVNAVAGGSKGGLG